MSSSISRRGLLAGAAGSLCAQTVIGSLRGRVILPADPEYDGARRLASLNPASDKHPRMIVRCAAAEDVVRAIAFARDHGLEVAIRSGGHDVLGASVCDGMVIDLTAMKTIRVDAVRRTARVEAGVRSGELNAALHSSGLAATLGCHPGVGVAGLTLGGGLGWLLGKHGAACDHLAGADVVTAEGKILRASEEENADLFWALRGGGGNFGIVTALDFRVHPVDRVLGGVRVFRADVVRFLRFYSDFMRAAPDELAVEISVLADRPPVIVAIVCWSGAIAEGERVLQPLRNFAAPLADWIGPVPYAQLTARMPEVGPLLGRTPPLSQSGPGYNYWRGGSLSALNPASVDRIAAAIERAPAGASLGLGHYMHGQICRIKPGATPLIRTPGQVTYFLSASWADPRQADGNMDWVNRSWAALQHFSSRGAYINYLSVDDHAAVQASYGANYRRLSRIKKRYDPSNFFHRNRNIRP